MCPFLRDGWAEGPGGSALEQKSADADNFWGGCGFQGRRGWTNNPMIVRTDQLVIGVRLGASGGGQTRGGRDFLVRVVVLQLLEGWGGWGQFVTLLCALAVTL